MTFTLLGERGDNNYLCVSQVVRQMVGKMGRDFTKWKAKKAFGKERDARVRKRSLSNPNIFCQEGKTVL